MKNSILNKFTFTLLSCLLLVPCSSQKTLITADNGRQYTVYWGLAAANLVPKDSVDGLVICCDKIDSIKTSITKFTNLRYLTFTDCTVDNAAMTGALEKKEADTYNRKVFLYDSLKLAKARELAESGKGHINPMFGWDSLLFINNIKHISREFYDLKRLEYINIQCNISKEAKNSLLKYRKRKKYCLFIGKLIKCKEYKLR